MRGGQDHGTHFGALYELHHDAVRRYVARRTDESDVDDIVSETFLVVWRRLREVPRDARPWIFRVAANVLRNHARSASRRDALAARIRHQEPYGGGLDGGIDQKVAHAFLQLAPDDQELLALIAWDGLSPREAAVATGRSATATRVRLHRARRRIEALLVADPAAAGQRQVGPLRTEEPV